MEMRSLYRRRLCLVVSLLSLTSHVVGLPNFIVDSGKPKCVQTEIPKDTFVRIYYDAPDISTDKNDPEYGPTYLTVLEKSVPTAWEMLHNDEDIPKHRKKEPSPRSVELVQNKGSVGHKGSIDAMLNICIRASTAGSKNPLRFGIRVQEIGEEGDGSADENHGNHPPLADVQAHLSYFEGQLVRLENSMHAMLREADFSQERDAVYHTKTDAMHKATIFWPFLHCGILLLTGFTQANHIVQFFKKRRII